MDNGMGPCGPLSNINAHPQPHASFPREFLLFFYFYLFFGNNNHKDKDNNKNKNNNNSKAVFPWR